MSNLVECYRTPAIERTSSVSLDDFDDDAIVEYLRRRGFAVDGKKGTVVVMHTPLDRDGDMVIEKGDLDRIRVLALAGQREAAMEHIIWLFRKAIKDLTL